MKNMMFYKNHSAVINISYLVWYCYVVKEQEAQDKSWLGGGLFLGSVGKQIVFVVARVDSGKYSSAS